MDAVSADIYHRAIKRFGAERQLRKLQEELCEAAVAIAHYIERIDTATLCALDEELADVEIMLEQARLILGGDWIERAKARKLERLEVMLEDGHGPT